MSRSTSPRCTMESTELQNTFHPTSKDILFPLPALAPPPAQSLLGLCLLAPDDEDYSFDADNSDKYYDGQITPGAASPREVMSPTATNHGTRIEQQHHGPRNNNNNSNPTSDNNSLFGMAQADDRLPQLISNSFSTEVFEEDREATLFASRKKRRKAKAHRRSQFAFLG